MNSGLKATADEAERAVRKRETSSIFWNGNDKRATAGKTIWPKEKLVFRKKKLFRVLHLYIYIYILFSFLKKKKKINK